MNGIRIACCSEPGGRSHNEDDLRQGESPNGPYAVLADGAGGHRRGAEAARRAVDCIERTLRERSLDFAPDTLTGMARQAHLELQRHQGSERPDARMHCTLVVLWIHPDGTRVLWTHIGDSRLYRIRNGRTDVITVDDSLVQQLVLSGIITAEQSRRHPQKNQLLAALGVAGDVEPHTVARAVELQQGDAFLLCSDGWWEAFDGDDVAATLLRALTPQDWLQDMRAQILARATPNQDNFSAIAVWIGDPADALQPDDDDTRPKALSRY